MRNICQRLTVFHQYLYFNIDKSDELIQKSNILTLVFQEKMNSKIDLSYQNIDYGGNYNLYT